MLVEARYLVSACLSCTSNLVSARYTCICQLQPIHAHSWRRVCICLLQDASVCFMIGLAYLVPEVDAKCNRKNSMGMIAVCCGQVKVPDNVEDNAAAQFLVRMTVSWHAAPYQS